jgi:uncharacterized protein
MAVDTYILKVASRCNLNCAYCYVYNMGDESYRTQPYRMSPQTVAALLSRIRTYSREESLGQVSFIFHGGEPLLAGMEFFRDFVESAARLLQPDIEPAFVLETNGTLLTPEWLDLICDLDIGFGISLDGSPAAHDANRVNHAGAGSYRKVRNAVEAALADPRLDHLFGGVLTVIDPETDPIEVYRHHREMGLRRCDFLLPDGTHDRPPPRRGDDPLATPYADWLIAIFDEWFGKEDIGLSVRIFEDIIRLVFRGGFATDSLGGGENDILVIETDGGIEPVDVLKICGPGFTKVGLNVHRNDIRDASGAELIRLYQEGAAGLCETCRACPVGAVCGGGYLPHRYRSANGFANPSVYCRDLMKLITHIQGRVVATIPAATRRKLALEPLSYQQASAFLDLQ